MERVGKGIGFWFMIVQWLIYRCFEATERSFTNFDLFNVYTSKIFLFK